MAGTGCVGALAWVNGEQQFEERLEGVKVAKDVGVHMNVQHVAYGRAVDAANEVRATRHLRRIDFESAARFGEEGAREWALL